MAEDNHEEPLIELHPHMQGEETTPKFRPNQLLRLARDERLLSQAELAELVEVRKETISRWENGASKPQRYQLRKLCEVFGKPPEALGYPLKASIEEDPPSSVQSDEASRDGLVSPPENSPGPLKEASTREDQPWPMQSDEILRDGSAPSPVQEPSVRPDGHDPSTPASLRPVWSRRWVTRGMVLGALGLVSGVVTWIISAHPWAEGGKVSTHTAHSWPTVVYDLHRHTERVRVVQYMLKARQYDIGPTGIDGVFGSYTESAVRAFQGNQRLLASGQVDSPTWEQLTMTSGIGSRGSQVTTLQECLHILGFLPESDIDGDFGKNTAQAIRQFQQQQRLPQTSEADLNTWSLLVWLIPS